MNVHDSLQTLGVDDSRLGAASALVVINYQLDPRNLTGTYFEQLERAVDEFCCAGNELLPTINDVFEETYLEVFDEEPAGKFPGYLSKRV